jgi:hypothetical protein
MIRDLKRGMGEFGLEIEVVKAVADGMFTGTAVAGQYFLVMLAECTATGGSFSYGATFTAVPGPGGAVALLLIGCPVSRRRRLR